MENGKILKSIRNEDNDLCDITVMTSSDLEVIYIGHLPKTSLKVTLWKWRGLTERVKASLLQVHFFLGVQRFSKDCPSLVQNSSSCLITARLDA